VPRLKFDPDQIFVECNGAGALMQQQGACKFMIAKGNIWFRMLQCGKVPRLG
jgi:hypothetical protein